MIEYFLYFLLILFYQRKRLKKT